MINLHLTNNPQLNHYMDVFKTFPLQFQIYDKQMSTFVKNCLINGTMNSIDRSYCKAILDFNGNFLWLDKRAWKFFGIQKKDLYLQNWFDLVNSTLLTIIHKRKNFLFNSFDENSVKVLTYEILKVLPNQITFKTKLTSRF